MSSVPCKATERAFNNLYFEKLGDKQREEENFKNAYRHAIKDNCPGCWNYIREKNREVFQRTREKYIVTRVSYAIWKNNLILLLSYKNSMIFRCYLNLSRSK